MLVLGLTLTAMMASASTGVLFADDVNNDGTKQNAKKAKQQHVAAQDPQTFPYSVRDPYRTHRMELYTPTGSLISRPAWARVRGLEYPPELLLVYPTGRENTASDMLLQLPFITAGHH